MTLEEILAQDDPSLVTQLSSADLIRFYWKWKGLKRQFARDTEFFVATNENLKLAYEKLDEQERELSRAYAIIREDLGVAKQVQTALLPAPLAEMEGQIELAVFHRQLTEVGGDYYDFFRMSEGRYAIGLFDISGHGVSAALIMAFLKAQFTQAMEGQRGLHEIVNQVNISSFDFLREVRRYATINLVALDADSIRYVSGGGYGHLLRLDGQSHQFQKGSHFLGLRKKPYEEHVLPFTKGDILALYTDGMIEAQDQSEAHYSARRLHAIIEGHRDLPMQEILAQCVSDYQAFRQQDSDDCTLILIRRKS
jgi:sigma-B regulation protein RsbU (phosphoserine phosphatase)